MNKKLEKLMASHYIETIPEDCNTNVAYVLQGDGVYERRKNKIGCFVRKLANCKVIGLDNTLEEGFTFSIPKIPVGLFGTTIAFFRKIYSLYSSEVFVQFYYNTETNEYILYCPLQEVSTASVKYENDEEFDKANKVLVLEVHSHGGMGAFFSGTDDKDEVSDRFYGVVGKISQFFPETKFRMAIGGKHIDIDIDDVFNLDEEIYHIENFPEDWTNRVKKQKVEVKKNVSKPTHYEKDVIVYPGSHREFFNETQSNLFDEMADKCVSGNYNLDKDIEKSLWEHEEKDICEGENRDNFIYEDEKDAVMEYINRNHTFPTARQLKKFRKQKEHIRGKR